MPRTTLPELDDHPPYPSRQTASLWQLLHASPDDTPARLAPDIQVGLMFVTPSQAAYWQERFAYEHQRRLRDYHVERLARAILSDTFETSEINFYDYGEGPKCLNGWHRLHAITRANKGVWLTVCYHRNVTREEAKDAYRRYDVGMIRGLYEILGAAEVDAELDFPTYMALKVNSAANLIQYRFDVRYLMQNRTNYRDYEAVLFRIRQWAPEARKYLRALKLASGGVKRNLQTRAVMAVALVTYRHVPDRAPDFWETVAENSGLLRGEAAHTMVNYLADLQHHHTMTNTILRGVATAWNAFYEERGISVVRVNNPEAPIRIEGTPFLGRDPAPDQVPYALAPPIPASFKLEE